MLQDHYTKWIDAVEGAFQGDEGGLELRQDQQRAWVVWILGAASWRSFITLEFKDIVGRDRARACWRSLVQTLNRDLWGNHYTRDVGHCYFAYLVGYEQQKRGSFHLHALVDRPVNYQLIHDTWHILGGDAQAKLNPSDRSHIGFAWIDQIKDVIASVVYVTKYVSKGGDLEIHLPQKWVYKKEPPFKPMWWLGI